MNGYSIAKVKRSDIADLILNIHYAKRWPSISYAFGLFYSNTLCGCITYGTPPSAPLRSGICGPNFSGYVLELNRLVLTKNRKNEASYLVSNSLKMIATNQIVVSFADTSQNHCGYVYQACNFLYCGLSAKRTDWKVKGLEHLHGQTIADEFRGQPDRSLLMKEKYGDDFYLADRPRKHRYVIFVGDNRFKKQAHKALRYACEPYPKKN